MPPGRGSSVAPCPIQRVAFTGSVKKSKTVSGAASIRTSRSIAWVWLVPASTFSPLLFLGFLLELVEAERPEALEELAQLREPLWACAVEAPGPFAALGHEA